LELQGSRKKSTQREDQITCFDFAQVLLSAVVAMLPGAFSFTLLTARHLLYKVVFTSYSTRTRIRARVVSAFWFCDEIFSVAITLLDFLQSAVAQWLGNCDFLCHARKPIGENFSWRDFSIETF
jgi:hypothetical protein